MTNKLKRNIKNVPEKRSLKEAVRKAKTPREAGAANDPMAKYKYKIQEPVLPPGVVPKGQSPAVAMDSLPCFQPDFINSCGGYGISSFAGFPGYPYLAMLDTRAEYRAFAQSLSTELTREWIEFASSDDKDDVVKEEIELIETEFKRLDVKGVIQKAAEDDCKFGRGQIFIKLAGQERDLPLVLDPRTVPLGSLEGFKVVEALWTSPNAYNALDPAADDFYKPSSWFMLGVKTHASRLLTIITRPLPDLFKPAYNFSGMSLYQLAEPYVDNWLRTRQSVSDLINNFSITALKTAMDQVLQGTDDGENLYDRLDMFTATRSNRGIMALDKDREELVQINTPLSGLPELQAQSQEHMCSVSRMPAIILTGIDPTGLNASSEGSIRCWNDWIAAQQSAHYQQPIETMLKVVQLSLFGKINPKITFRFVPLYQLNGKEEAEVRTADGTTDCAYVDRQVLSAQEVRERLARDPLSGYQGLDIDAAPPPAPETPTEGEQPPEGLKDQDGQQEQPSNPENENVEKPI